MGSLLDTSKRIRMNKEVARVILIFVIGSYHVSRSKQDPINEESMIWQVNPFSKSTFRNQFKKLYPNEQQHDQLLETQPNGGAATELLPLLTHPITYKGLGLRNSKRNEVEKLLLKLPSQFFQSGGGRMKKYNRARVLMGKRASFSTSNMPDTKSMDF